MEGRIKHYLISGRVQGVGYRAFTAHIAQGLGVLGWVRNLPDGRVEIVASGQAKALDEFEQALKKGPRLGLVDTMTISDWRGAGDFSEFTIRRDLA